MCDNFVMVYELLLHYLSWRVALQAPRRVNDQGQGGARDLRAS